MDVSEKAKELFKTGLNCAQAVSMALAPSVDLSEDTAKALSAAFGGGVARMHSEICGAVSGMLIAIGAAHPEMSKTEVYALSRQAIEEFRAENGSINCGELLAGVTKDNSPIASPRTDEYYKKRPCADLVKSAAEIAPKYLK